MAATKHPVPLASARDRPVEDDLSPVQSSSTFKVKHSDISELNEGFIFPGNDGSNYTINEKLGPGGEGHTYKATDSFGDVKTVKIVTPGSSTKTDDLEKKLNDELEGINSVLGREYKVFAVNPLDIAVIGDYVPGQNLEEELNYRKRTFTQVETADCLLQLLDGDLKVLHDSDLMHGDIKPHNIIINEENGGFKYTLIDFGLVRRDQTEVTMTATVRGTPAYMRPNLVNDKSDDFYSLAETAYFLLTGKNPEYIAHDRFDKIDDKEKLQSLNIDSELRKVLWNMLGHDKKSAYKDVGVLVKDLTKVRKRISKGSIEVGIDLDSSRKLTNYLEKTQVPTELQQRINGLEKLFSSKYARSVAHRHPLERDYTDSLNEVLTELGYLSADESNKLLKNYDLQSTLRVRKRKNSTAIDIFGINHGDNKDYFYQKKTKDIETAQKILSQFEVKHGLYKPMWWASQLLTPIAVGMAPGLMTQSFGGTVVGGVVGLFVAGFSTLTSGDNKLFPKKEDPRVNKSYMDNGPITNYSHVAGKASHQLFNAFRKSNYNSNRKSDVNFDTSRLGRALTPAEKFVYER